MTNTFDLDRVRRGQLIDGDPDSPYQSCTVTREQGKSATIAVPFVNGEPQFAAADQWFGDRTAPKTLLYNDDDGPAGGSS